MKKIIVCMKITLGTIGADGTEISFGETIPHDVFIKIEKCLKEINGFKESLQLYELVKLNETELNSIFKIILDELTVKSVKWNGVTDDDILRLTTELNRRLLNYLSSVRTYIDHSETSINRRFGNDSEQLKDYKKLLSTTYDNSFAYRFFYKLRNYAQHCGLPIKWLGYSLNKDSAESIIKVNMKISFDRDELLNNFNSWGEIVKKDLLKQSEKIDFVSLLNELIEQIHLIYENLKRDQVQSIMPSIEYVKSISSHLKGDDIKVCIFSNYIPQKNGGLTVTKKYIPYDFIDKICENENSSARC